MAGAFSLIKTLAQVTPVAVGHSLGMLFNRSLAPEQLASEALAQLLQASLEEVADHQWQGVHQGTTRRWRLLLPGLDKSLFAKTNPEDFSTRFFGAMFGLSTNELGFYRDLQPHLNIQTPACGGLLGNRYRYLILLEDLQAKAEFADLSSRCDVSRAESVIDTLAALHASTWQDARFDQQWRWINRQEYKRNHAFLTLLREQSSVAAVKRYGDLLPEQTPLLAKTLNGCYPQLEQRWSQGERCLVHGDAHIGNMYFLPDGSTGLLDWQVIGFEHGMRDVTYFLINSVPTEVRQQHQQQLIQRYVNRLNELGIEFTVETALQQYPLHASYVWISAAVTAASNTLQEKKIAAAGLVRASKAMVDLEVQQTLNSL